MSDTPYPLEPSSPRGHTIREADIEAEFIAKLEAMKYVVRADIRDRKRPWARFA